VTAGGPEAVGPVAERARDGRAGASSQQTAAAATGPDPYAVLGLAREASDADVRQAWRRLMRENHPDSLAARGVPPEFVKRATDKVAGRGDLWLVLAQVSLDRAEALPAAGRRPGLDEGLAAVARALKLTPGFPRALAVEGALLLRKAEGERDAAARKVAEERARASLAQAFAGNPLLERRYGGARPGP